MNHADTSSVRFEWKVVDEDSGTPPPPLRGAIARTIGGKVYVFGGWDGKIVRDDTWIFDGGTILSQLPDP